ncbi:hypothetical protein OEK97_28570, partial [Escherichia coli]|uniref:hypothetical protein n=1 Tax=Escherichia coli TaxID=562 RepID=UPI0021D932F8
MKIILKGNPLSTGSIYKIVCRGRFGAYYVSKAGKDLKLDYQSQVRKQYKGKPLIGDLEIDIKLFFGTKRKCDWDN